MTTREEREALLAAGGLQPLPPPRRRRPHRPAHRLRHRRHVGRAVGRRCSGATSPTPAAAPGSASRRGARAHRLPAHHPHPPGTRRRAILFAAVGGPGRSSRTTPTSTPRAPTSRHSARRPSTSRSPEGAEPAATHPFKGNIDLGALERAAPRARATACRVVMYRHQQLRRRPAGLAGEPAARVRESATATASRSSSTPAASPRTPGSSSSGRRARRDRSVATIAREMLRARRRLHLQRQEGRPRQHRRLPGAERRRRLAEAGSEPAHPDRGLPHLRRPGRPRPRGDRRGPRARCSTRTTSATALRSTALPGREPAGRGHADRAAAGRPRRLHRRAALLPAHPAAGVPGPGPGLRALSRRAACAACEIGTRDVRRQPAHGAERAGRWSSCASPSRAGSTPRATSTT